MTSQHARPNIDPALQHTPPSPSLGALGLFIGCILIAIATWLGAALRDDPDSLGRQQPGRPLKLVDAERALIFDANTANGDVRVLSVRSGISEIARLRAEPRRDVSAISLDPQRRVLTVESTSGRYQYDTQTFRLIAQSAVLATGPDT